MLEIGKDLALFYLTTLLACRCFLSSVTFFLMVNSRRDGWPVPGLDCPPGQHDQGCCSETQVGLPQGGCNAQKRHTHGKPSAARGATSAIFCPQDSIFSVGQTKTLALLYKGNHCSPAKIPQSRKARVERRGKKIQQILK